MSTRRSATRRRRPLVQWVAGCAVACAALATSAAGAAQPASATTADALATSAAGATHPASATTPDGPAPAAVQPGLGVRLLEVPQSRAADPRAQRYIVDHVSPGAVIERRMEVSNGTERIAAINLYAAAASLSQGEFAAGDGRAANDLTSWITMTPSELLLRPGDAAHVTIRIAVPRDAAPGERYALALAELPPQAPAAGALGVAVRAGIRVYLSVGPGGEPGTDFAIDELTVARDDAGRPVVTAVVRNTGARALDLSGEMRLRDGPGKLAAGPFPTDQLVTLAPGDREGVAVVLDPAIPAGPWDAHVVLRSGELEREASALVLFPEVGAGSLTVPAEAPPGRSVPALLLLAALMLIVVTSVGIGVAMNDRRRARAHAVVPS